MNQQFMLEAIKQARLAAEKKEIPVGCVVVSQNRIIARAYNQVETLKDPTAHAEMIALTQAASYLANKWLYQCEVYVTVEPCSMCAGALVLARIKNLFFGAFDPKTGACGSVLNVASNRELNHRIKVQGGILQEECAALLDDFFKSLRKSRPEKKFHLN